MMLRFLTVFALVVCLGCDTASQGGSAADRNESKPKLLLVVCTTGQVGDMLANIGGTHVTVKTLMGEGVDPHLYRATPGSTKLLSDADVVFYNGLHLEGRLADVLENLAGRKPTFAVTEDLEKQHPDRLRNPPQFEGYHDPHVWFDASLWVECVQSATRRLSEVDPNHADDYERNAKQYVAQLDALHEECKQRLATIPKEQRVLVTAHDAFGYFGLAYDVEVHGLQGISTADEADLSAVTKLVELLVNRKIKAVFVESSVPPKNIQSLIEGCAARGHKVAQGGELFSDALGKASTTEGTYIGVMHHNLKTIVSALK